MGGLVGGEIKRVCCPAGSGAVPVSPNAITRHSHERLIVSLVLYRYRALLGK